MSSTMVQMNTRIPADLKEKGDRALERAGYTPSQAVRALWEFAARHAYEPSAVRGALGERKTKIVEKRANPFEEWETTARRMYHDMGIAPDTNVPEISYEELKELAYKERYDI